MTTDAECITPERRIGHCLAMPGQRLRVVFNGALKRHRLEGVAPDASRCRILNTMAADAGYTSVCSMIGWSDRFSQNITRQESRVMAACAEPTAASTDFCDVILKGCAVKRVIK